MNTAFVRERAHQYALLMRLHRPIGILLLLWPTLWALWIAGAGRPNAYVAFVFIAGVVLMRSAGCAVNDYADREFDPFVARTRERPLATGRVSPREALALFVALSLIAFALVLSLNALTVALSGVAVLLAATYPFTKRYTQLPQVYLGLAFGWGIPMAFAAQLGHVPAIAWWLFAANIAWTVAYDTEYAMADRADDLKIGVKSTAILFGRADRAMVALCHALALALLVYVGLKLGRGAFYYAGLALAAAVAVYQQFVIRARARAACFGAFLNNNYFGLAVFAGLVLDYWR